MTTERIMSKALDEIEGVLCPPYALTDAEDGADHWRIMAIGHIWGIVTFTKELLKEVEE